MLKHRWWYFYFLDLMIYHLSGLTLRVSTASFQYLFPQSILLLSFYFYHFSFPNNIQIPTPDAFIVEWTLWSSTWFVEWCKNIWNSQFIGSKSLRFVAQKPYKNSLFIYKNLSQIIKKSEYENDKQKSVKSVHRSIVTGRLLWIFVLETLSEMHGFQGQQVKINFGVEPGKSYDLPCWF